MKDKEAIAVQKQEKIHTGKHALIRQKVHNVTLKKFYEHKITSLAGRDMPPHLLRIMCQDVPVVKDDLGSWRGRHSFMKKCRRYYRGIIRKIERSEKNWFSSFCSSFSSFFA